MRRGLSILILGACAISRSAFADDDPASRAPGAGEPLPPLPARTFPGARTPDEAGPAKSPWRQRYEAARKELVDGDFKAAQIDFLELARTADNEVDHAIAQEDADLAGDWVRLDRAFVRRIDLGESHLTPKALDHRTGDELVSLYANGVLYGVGTGVWIDVLIADGQSNPSSAVLIGLPIGIMGASITGIALADSQAHAFRYGGAQATVSGLYIGFEEGFIWTSLAARVAGPDSGRGLTTALWGASTAGAVTGGLVGAYVPTTPGRASFVGSMAFWSGVLAGSLVGATEHRDGDTTAPLVASGLALNAGLIGGILTASSVSPMIARVRLLDLGGAAGYAVGAGLYGAVASSGSGGTGPGYAGFGALGCAAGLTGMWFATAGMGDDRREVAPASALQSVTPTIMPLDRGAALGVRGSL